MSDKQFILNITYLAIISMVGLFFFIDRGFELQYSKQKTANRYFFSQHSKQTLPNFQFGGGGVLVSGIFNHEIIKNKSNNLLHKLSFEEVTGITFDDDRTMFYQPSGNIIEKPLHISTDVLGRNKNFLNDGSLPVLARVSPSTITELRFVLPELPSKHVYIDDHWAVSNEYYLKKDGTNDSIKINEDMNYQIIARIKNFKAPLRNNANWSFNVVKIEGEGKRVITTDWGMFGKVKLNATEKFTGYYCPQKKIWVYITIKYSGTASNFGVIEYTNKYMYCPTPTT